jgi:phosphoribosylanthranilate isomerase
MAQAKICGITTPEALDAAVNGGARFVGFVLFPKSPRHLQREQLAALLARARGRVETVIVTVDADDALLSEIGALRPDWIQLHGAESAQRVGQARAFARTGVIKALGVARAEDFTAAAAFEAAADMVMFDAKPPPGAAIPGGNAVAFDWGLMAGRRFARPWMLSGGLHSGNLREAITVSGAQLVDVSSGVESRPGLKDPALVAAFLAEAKA